jgi:hypothetical protein
MCFSPIPKMKLPICRRYWKSTAERHPVPYGYVNQKGELEQIFDLNDFSLKEIDNTGRFSRLGTKAGDLLLQWRNDPAEGPLLLLSEGGCNTENLPRPAVRRRNLVLWPD